MLFDAAHYVHGNRRNREPLTIAEAGRLGRAGPGFVWISFVEPDPAEVLQFHSVLGMATDAVQDFAADHKRAKFEELDDKAYLFILRTAQWDADRQRALFGRLGLYLHERIAISARWGGPRAQGRARALLENDPALLAAGAPAVLLRVIQRVVMDIQPVVDDLDEDIAQLEAGVLEEKDRRVLTRRVYQERRELVDVSRAVHPMLAPLNAIERGAYPALEPLRRDFREVNGDAKQIHFDLGGMRERLDSVFDANLALLTQHQNDIVQRISGVAAIIALPTLIAGIYGMNFVDIPGLKATAGFWVCIVAMVVLAGSIFVLLRRAKWM